MEIVSHSRVKVWKGKLFTKKIIMNPFCESEWPSRGEFHESWTIDLVNQIFLLHYGLSFESLVKVLLCLINFFSHFTIILRSQKNTVTTLQILLKNIFLITVIDPQFWTSGTFISTFQNFLEFTFWWMFRRVEEPTSERLNHQNWSKRAKIRTVISSLN